MAVATRPARRARAPKRRRYVNVGAGGREADLEAIRAAASDAEIERQQASRGASLPASREERDERGGRRPRRAAPAPAVPARSEEPVEEPVEEAPEFATADADERLAYEFLSSLIEELPQEDLPEDRAEIEEESEDLARLAETLGTPLFASVPKALLARARGVIVARQEAVADLLHERRYEPEDDALGEEVAPGLFETMDGRLVDEQGVEYTDVDDDETTLGPVLVDDAGNRYAVDEDEGLILLSAPAPERDEQGRFLPREGADATVSESADTQPETERDDEDEETE